MIIPTVSAVRRWAAARDEYEALKAVFYNCTSEFDRILNAVPAAYDRVLMMTAREDEVWILEHLLKQEAERLSDDLLQAARRVAGKQARTLLDEVDWRRPWSC